MRQIRAWLIVLLLLPALAVAENTAHKERRLDRLVASPTNAATLSDQSWYRVEVENGTVVTIDATASGTSLFSLKYNKWNQPQGGSPLPSARQGALLQAGIWSVVIDPAAGADVHITILFDGHVSDITGAPAPFALNDVAVDRACATPEVCLP